MTLEFLWTTALLVISVGHAIYRAWSLRQPRPASTSTSPVARLNALLVFWLALTVVVMAILIHPWVRSLLSTTGWFQFVPRHIGSTISAVVSIWFIGRVIPLRPGLRRVLIGYGLSLLVLLPLLSWALLRDVPGGRDAVRESVIYTFYNLQILVNSLVYCLPAFAWLIRHEPDPVLRTRVYGTQMIWIASGLWAGLGILEAVAVWMAPALTGGNGPDSMVLIPALAPVYMVLGIGQLTGFILYFVLPHAWVAALTRAGSGLWTHGTALGVGLLADLVAVYNQRDARRRSWLAGAESVEVRAYLDVIAIMDGRRELASQPQAPAQSLARSIGSAIQVDTAYPDARDRLAWLGLRHSLGWILARITTFRRRRLMATPDLG
jgi:hypothetical protein